MCRGERSTTLQQILREQLARVHLDLTLTRHRYEGWVVAMRLTHWNALGDDDRARLVGRLSAMRDWQRREAALREDAAQRELTKQAMTAYPVTLSTWHTYRAMQPAWEDFLPESLSQATRTAPVTLAAQAASIDPARAPREALPQAQPSAP